MPASTHDWQFFRAGGLDQVRFTRAADYANLGSLDQKLWAALACPVAGLDLDQSTLELVDGDKDGRVRAPELIAAVAWLERRIKDLGALSRKTDVVPLESLRQDTAEGKALHAAARQALVALGKPPGTLTLEEVEATQAALDAAPFNGDGIVPPGVVSDPSARALAEDVVATLGGVPGRGGVVGVDQAQLEAFHAAAAAFVAWQARPAAEPGILALGEGTAAAVAVVEAVRAKVDDYFGRCSLAAWDPRSLAALDRGEEPFAAIGASSVSLGVAEAAELPLAHVRPGATLPLVDGVNPAWVHRIAALREVVVAWSCAPQTELDAATWSALLAALAPFQAWTAARPDTPVANLSAERLQAAVDKLGSAELSRLIQEDQAAAADLTATGELEKLVRLHRDLDRLLRNFVNFEEFYSPEPATFQAGTLYLDGRACELCVFVNDPGAHAGLGGSSQAYLVYCELSRPSGEKRNVCAAITDGDGDYLFVGRNGIFYDRKGQDWDARIVKIVANPISVREAFWTPYKNLVRMIDAMVAKRAADAEAASDAKVGGLATTAANADKLEAPKEPARIDVGTVAAMGVAVGAVGAFITTLIGYLTGLFTLPLWEVILVFLGAMLVISGPSMMIAWLKLRQRNMGPILDACGWAVNGRVKLGVSFGKSMTTVAEVPLGSRAGGADPFGEKASSWPAFLRILVILTFAFSLANTLGLVEMAFEEAGVRMPKVLKQVERVPEPTPEVAPVAAEAPAG